MTKYETYHFPGIDSTNSWAIQNTHLFHKDRITLVLADKQSAGRGRFRNHWESPKEKNIYATFGVFLDLEKGVQTNLSQLMALAATETLERAKINSKIKWPNDLLVNGKKIAGILTETEFVNDSIFYAIGIGLNINMNQEELQNVGQPATSLLLELGKESSVLEILELLKQSFSNYFEIFLDEGFSPLANLFKDRVVHKKGEEIVFKDKGIENKGFFHSINLDGSLNITNKDNMTVRLV